MQWNVSALLQLTFEFSERQWVNITIALMPTLGILLKKKKLYLFTIFFYSSAKENSLSAQSTTPAQTQRAKFSRVVMPIFLSY